MANLNESLSHLYQKAKSHPLQYPHVKQVAAVPIWNEMMTVMDVYPVVRWVHMALVATSGTLFVVRGVSVMRGAAYDASGAAHQRTDRQCLAGRCCHIAVHPPTQPLCGRVAYDQNRFLAALYSVGHVRTQAGPQPRCAFMVLPGVGAVLGIYGDGGTGAPPLGHICRPLNSCAAVCFRRCGKI